MRNSHCTLWHNQRLYRPLLTALLLFLFSTIALGLTGPGVAPVSASGSENPPPVQTYYLPLPEGQLLEALQTIYGGATWIPVDQRPVNPIYTYVTIAAFTDGTIIYYDQMENGYDANPSNPASIYHPVTNPSGTQIWGDGDPSNGHPPGMSDDLIGAGTVIVLQNWVDTTVAPNPNAPLFRGGDKISANKAIAVSWAGWANQSQTLLAGANELFDTFSWGTDYRIPVGENIATDIPTAVGEMFQYTGAAIMAGPGGATVQIDANADGTFETSVTLAEGESHLINGGLLVGARFLADAPVQVDLLTGDRQDGYESRFYRLLPTDLWTDSYYTPVASPPDVNAVDGQFYDGTSTTVWLYNPGSSTITVTYQWRDTNGDVESSDLSVPAGGYARQVLNDGSGARFFTASNEPFYALSTTNSTGTTLSNDSPGQNRTWDWGFTLVPDRSLTSQVLVGLGIGRDPTSSVNPTENGSPVWITTVGNGDTPVTVYVDYDADPTTGPLTDPNGFQYDVAYTLRELDQLKIYNPSGDQSGMLVYTLDSGVKLAAAWGQDVLTSSPGQPGLDMGTGIPPLPYFVATKRSVLFIDNDGDGVISPGDVLEYEITIENVSRLPIDDLLVEDVLPASVTYELNSTTFTNHLSVTVPIADDGATPFPLDEGGYTLPGSLPPLQSWSVNYRVLILPFDQLPSGTITIQNQASINSALIPDPVGAQDNQPLYGRIGDRVWFDSDGNGLQDSGEPGIAGLTVNLLDGSGNLVATTVTDANGNYLFAGLLPGSYQVQFVAPPGSFTTQNADGEGVAGENNSDADANGLTPVFTLAAGQPFLAVDAGLLSAGFADLSLVKTVDPLAVAEGQTVTYSIVVNNNGPNDATGIEVTEPLVTGITYLGHSATQGTYQNITGIWTIGALNAGSSAVLTIFASVDAGTMGSSLTNTATITASDLPDPVSGNNEDSAELYVSELQVSKTSVVQGPVLPGDVIPYTIVVNNMGAAAQTGVNVFDTVPAGTTYVADSVDVTVEPPVGPGGTETVVFNASGTFVVPAGVTSITVEAWGGGGGGGKAGTGGDNAGGGGGGGGYARGSVSVTPGDSYAVTVGTGGATATAGGNSWFDLTSVVFAAGGGAGGEGGSVGTGGSANIGNQATNNGGSGGAGATGGGPPGGRSGGGGGGSATALAAGGAGQAGTAGGVGGAGEGPGGQGNTGATNGGGGLAPGGGGGGGGNNSVGGAGADGRVRISYELPGGLGTIGDPPNLASGWTLEPGATMTVTFAVTVNDPVTVSEILNVVSITSDQLPLPVSDSHLTSVAASVLAAIGDRIWLDENGDGIQDAGEAGIANVLVQLYAADGVTLLATTSTDSNGNYLFTNLPPGDYLVRVDTTSMSAGLAANPTFDEDGIATPHQTSVTLTSGQTYTTADFGYNWSSPAATGNPAPGATGAIGDRVWIDANGDGIQDPGEPGLGGVPVAIYYDANGDGVYDALYTAAVDQNGNTGTGTTTTNPDGSYVFYNLPPGAYVIVVNDGNPPVGYTQAGDPDQFSQPCTVCDNRTTAPVILPPGDVYVNADFGYQPDAIYDVSGSVYLDANVDGSRSGEPGIAGVTVNLVDSAGNIIATSTTDAAGNYTFTGVPNGSYTVVVGDTANVLNGLQQTGDPDEAGVCTICNGQTPITVNNASVTGLDFGYTPAGHSAGQGLIGDTIFLDRDGNGQPGPGEGLQGVVVNLYAGDGTTLLATTITDLNGNYYFGGLADGNYVVRVDTTTLPNGGIGLTNSVDPDGGTANESNVTISGGNINLDQDFGYTATNPNTIGGTIWNDANADGTLDGDEAGRFAGVTVVLRDSAGNVVATTTTDGNGDYSFTGLPDGTYTVDVTDANNVLNGAWHSAGPNPGADNNSQPDPYTVTVSGGETNTTADFGYYTQPAALGDRIWLDVNGDGLQDPNEPGLPGVLVTLVIDYPNGDTITVTTVTDANGYYSFGNLLLDEDFNGSGGSGQPVYTISVDTTQPALAGLIPSPINVGSDGAVDSDDPAGTEATAVQGQYDDTYDFGFTGPVDTGNLPDIYNTLFNNSGPGHVLGSLTLGAAWDANTDGQPGATPTDNDGVVRDPNSLWELGNTVTITVEISGTAGATGYLVAWIDWDGDGSFGDGEMIVFDPLLVGSHALTLTVPNDYVTGTPLNVRFRLYETEPTDPQPTGIVMGGEVEDYVWAFSPTAVTLLSIAATAPQQPTALPVTIMLLMTLLFGISFIAFRRRAA